MASNTLTSNFLIVGDKATIDKLDVGTISVFGNAKGSYHQLTIGVTTGGTTDFNLTASSFVNKVVTIVNTGANGIINFKLPSASDWFTFLSVGESLEIPFVAGAGCSFSFETTDVNTILVYRPASGDTSILRGTLHVIRQSTTGVLCAI